MQMQIETDWEFEAGNARWGADLDTLMRLRSRAPAHPTPGEAQVTAWLDGAIYVMASLQVEQIGESCGVTFDNEKEAVQ